MSIASPKNSQTYKDHNPSAKQATQDWKDSIQHAKSEVWYPKPFMGVAEIESMYTPYGASTLITDSEGYHTSAANTEAIVRFKPPSERSEDMELYWDTEPPDTVPGPGVYNIGFQIGGVASDMYWTNWNKLYSIQAAGGSPQYLQMGQYNATGPRHMFNSPIFTEQIDTYMRLHKPDGVWTLTFRAKGGLNPEYKSIPIPNPTPGMDTLPIYPVLYSSDTSRAGIGVRVQTKFN